MSRSRRIRTALRPGTARRRALDAALAEIEAGREEPSVEWRQQYSLMLGLERLLAEDEPKLADGTVLSAHQVDALSGTLTALIAEAERQNGNGTAALRRVRGRAKRKTDDEDDEVEDVVDDDDELDDDEDEDEDDDEEPEAEDWPSPRRPTAPTRSRRTSFPSSRRTRAPPAVSGSSTRRAPARRLPRSASSRAPGPAAR